MAELKARIEDIDGLVKAIKTNSDAIDISVSSVKEPSKSKGIVVTEYIKRIREISQLLDKYKQLLDRDVLDIKDSKDKIQEMDKEMEKLSKN
ncbi:MAG: hypothetical protein E7287_00405 [Lachnospiraceae bacterium]|nr:hypothetical protein [Lachnospiraceae bacterium]